MLILELRDYLKEKRHANIMELSKHFGLDKDIMRSALNFFIEKGQITQFSSQSKCCADAKGCKTCSIEYMEIYDWNE